MSIWAGLNRGVLKRTSSYFFAATLFTFFFERAFEVASVAIFEKLNQNKLWKDVKDNFKKKEEEEEVPPA